MDGGVAVAVWECLSVIARAMRGVCGWDSLDCCSVCVCVYVCACVRVCVCVCPLHNPFGTLCNVFQC